MFLQLISLSSESSLIQDKTFVYIMYQVQGGSNMTRTDYSLFTHKSVPVIFEPPCILLSI
jgi:hypothetical protein